MDNTGHVCPACLAGDCDTDPDACTDPKRCTCCGDG